MTDHLAPVIRPFLQASAAALALLASTVAQADRNPLVPLLPMYQQECASCHIAFAPGMLPAASWQRLMANLPKHFGSDASLDAATTKALTTWLNANAGTYKRVAADPPPADRISRSTWFTRKHVEVEAAVWKRATIQSATNCAACHPQAAMGDFNEHSIRIPR
ncbi:MAG: diheme cytochrome c [Ideonella sp.]|nr:diheme cytochrome c [Ideonella sp.]